MIENILFFIDSLFLFVGHKKEQTMVAVLYSGLHLDA